MPFPSGFIGTRGPSAGTSNNVLTYATLGIARTFFIQNSSTNQFELQGNDIPGTLRIVRTDGSTLDIPASANWRNNGGSTTLIGILPRPAAPITFAYPGGSIQITDGAVSGGSSVGGYVAAYSGTQLADGASMSGNAAQGQVLDGLNSYLTTVVSSRPAGPVTVDALTTTSQTPTITGTATLAAGENLSVVVHGVQYTTSSAPAVELAGTNWSLAIATPLPVGTHSVAATITNADGFTLSDPTVNELVITPAITTLTVGGSFSASNRAYDGSLAATGLLTGLSLVGVGGSDDVTIATVTLAFQSAAVGTAKPVVVTGVALTGADAGKYIVSLAGAPTSTASISARALTVAGTFAAANKVFDGTAGATITTNELLLVGVVEGDEVAMGEVVATFAGPEVGAEKTVSLSTAHLTGAAAGNYTVSLAGAPTTTAAIKAAVPPSSPRSVSVTPGDGSLALSWTVPETAGCSAITGYVVAYTTDGGTSWTEITLTSPEPRTALIPGLVNNVAHQLRVAAINACGIGAYSAIHGPLSPIGPAVDGGGQLVPSAPGTTSSTSGGLPRPVATEIVQDTIVSVSGGDFTLRLVAADEAARAIPLDSSATLLLEHGGSANASGSGFAPGSFVTIYVFAPNGAPLLLGVFTVQSDGTFTANPPIPATLAPGDYTLQVNGLDQAGVPRSVAIGVEVAPPPPELELAAIPNELSPTIGQTITIMLTVTNRGRGPAIDVRIPRAFQEPGFTVTGATALEGIYQAAADEWRIDRIEPGAHARLLLTAVVSVPASIANLSAAAAGATP